MGIDPNTLWFLIRSRYLGAKFDRTVTLGRQNLYRLAPHDVDAAFAAAGIRAAPEVVSRRDHAWADWVFNGLGARHVDSLDYSDYEGASVICDMNAPLPDRQVEAFSVVFDGGSLEHIFNFPTALMNCMRMVEVGGHFITCGPANNFFGHGFYQFSAELWFRALSEANGFGELEVMLVEDHDSVGSWFKVQDPNVVGQRVTFSSATPTQMFVRARKIAPVSGWSSMPYQSDYMARWKQPGAQGAGSGPAGIVDIKGRLPGLRHWLKVRLFGGPRAHPRLFRPMSGYLDR
jgi:hypothetical protein